MLESSSDGSIRQLSSAGALVKPDLQYSLNKLVFYVRDEAPASPQPEYRISILHDPSDFVAFVVDFPILADDGKWPGVLLPGFGDEGLRAYERWLSIESSDEIKNFSCKFLKQFSELTNQSYKHFCRWMWNNVALDH